MISWRRETLSTRAICGSYDSEWGLWTVTDLVKCVRSHLDLHCSRQRRKIAGRLNLLDSGYAKGFGATEEGPHTSM